MSEFKSNSIVDQIIDLLTCYGFDLGVSTAEVFVEKWLTQYKAMWIRLAIIESLHRGRYKAISVEEILKFWERKGNTNINFNHEFERLICRNLPRSFALLSSLSPDELSESFVEFSDRATESVIKEEQEKSKNNDAISPQVSMHRTMPNLQEQKIQPLIPPLSVQPRNIVHFPTPINKFIPRSGQSNFYVKLKSVASQAEQEEE